MNESYIIEAYEFAEDGLPIVREKTTSQEKAVRVAEKLSKEYVQVFVSFYRRDDDCFGFINRGVGASFEQENWAVYSDEN